MSQINLKKNIALSSTSKVLTLVVAFVTNWFLARYLGPELRGKYVYLITLNSIIWMFLDLGVHKSYPYLLQKHKASINSLYKLNIITFIAGVVAVLILYFTAGDFFSGLVNHAYPRYIILTLGLYIICYQFFMRTQTLQLGSDRVREYAIWALLPNLAFMLLIIPLFWLMPKPNRVEYSFLLHTLVFFAALFVMQFRFKKNISLSPRLDGKLVGQAYKLGLRAFSSEYLITLLMRIDLIVLKALGSFAQVGIYTLALNFVDMINMSCNTIGAVLLVKLTSMKDELASLLIMRRIFLVVGIINTVVIIGMAIFGRWFIVKLYGVEYVDAYKAFMLMIPAVFGITLGALFNTFIWSKGFPVISIIAPIGPLALKLILNFFLVPRYGLFGTSAASSLSFVLWLIILLSWYFIRHPDISIKILIPSKEDFMYIRHEASKGLEWMKNKFQRGAA